MFDGKKVKALEARVEVLELKVKKLEELLNSTGRATTDFGTILAQAMQSFRGLEDDVEIIAQGLMRCLQAAGLLGNGAGKPEIPC